MWQQFWYDTRGATAVEYGIIISVLSMVIVSGLGFALGAVRDVWADNNSQITTTLTR
ncbi:Flp family type IVb pilin [Oricola sp.]|uniref:Flp family type IVb pilin n=1 Tax=Oricola sp. TaxID=1979950 RepID=UPI003BA87EA7